MKAYAEMTTTNLHLQMRKYTLSMLVNTLLGESSFLFLGLMLGNGFAYLYQMLMARMMSAAEYGGLVTLTSISYVIAVLMRTFQAWTIKTVSEAQNSTRTPVRFVFTLAMRTLAPLAVAALLLHWLVSPWVARFLQLDSATPIVVLGLYTFSSFLIPVPHGILLGLNRLYLASIISMIESLGRLLAGMLLVLWGLGVNGAIAAYAVGNLAGFAIATVALLPQLRVSGHGGRDVRAATGILDRYSMLVLVTNTALMIISNIDQVAVKHYFSAEVAGDYAVAFLLGKIITMTAIALGWVIFAKSATISPNSPHRARLLLKGLVITGAISTTLAAGYILAPVLVTQLMSGTQYGLAYSYVGLVGIEMTLFALIYVQAYYLISVRLTHHVAWPVLIATLLEVGVLVNFHATVEQILQGLIVVLGALLVSMSGLSWWILRDRSQEKVAQGVLSRIDSDRRNRRLYFASKRALDVFLASVGLIIAAPLLLAIAVAIKLDSRGPVLFKQMRIGKGGHPFTFYKFRSMYHNADAEIHRQYVQALIGNKVPNPSADRGSGSQYKINGDPRVTRVGYVLRRTSLDELPQLINVIKGDMSLVGPRPPLPYEVAEYDERHFGRLAAVPGLTGWWQVRGRSRVPFEEMVQMDLYYIAQQSFWLDLKIIALTIPAVISCKGAE